MSTQQDIQEKEGQRIYMFNAFAKFANGTLQQIVVHSTDDNDNDGWK